MNLICRCLMIVRFDATKNYVPKVNTVPCMFTAAPSLSLSNSEYMTGLFSIYYRKRN